MSGASIGRITADLMGEQEALDAIVAGLAEVEWKRPTSSPRWTIADQIGHLAYFDMAAARAIADPAAFAADVASLRDAAAGGDEAIEELTLFRELAPPQLLERWRSGRYRLAEAAATLAEESRVSWYGPSMGSKSFLSARLMETWAHGQDVVDAIGGTRPATDRLMHVARLGHNTRRWSYANRGLPAPEVPVRVDLEAPSGATWTFGAAEALESVAGPAEDFCLVVIQRRHLDDTGLVASPLAREWLLIAQAFAGPPTSGPAAGTRT